MKVHGYRVGNRAKIEMKGSVEEIAALMINLVEHRTREPHAADAEHASECIKWIFQKHINPPTGIRGE